MEFDQPANASLPGADAQPELPLDLEPIEIARSRLHLRLLLSWLAAVGQSLLNAWYIWAIKALVGATAVYLPYHYLNRTVFSHVPEHVPLVSFDYASGKNVDDPAEDCAAAAGEMTFAEFSIEPTGTYNYALRINAGASGVLSCQTYRLVIAAPGKQATDFSISIRTIDSAPPRGVHEESTVALLDKDDCGDFMEPDSTCILRVVSPKDKEWISFNVTVRSGVAIRSYSKRLLYFAIRSGIRTDIYLPEEAEILSTSLPEFQQRIYDHGQKISFQLPSGKGGGRGDTVKIFYDDTARSEERETILFISAAILGAGVALLADVLISFGTAVIGVRERKALRPW